jgi:hypothetical protein
MVVSPKSDNPERIPYGELVPLQDLKGDDDEETSLLRELEVMAKGYVKSYSWCVTILDGFFGGGIGRILGIFLFCIVPSRAEIDEWLWIIVGDVPSAYLPLEQASSPREVFQLYCQGLIDWSEWARSGCLGQEAPKMFHRLIFRQLWNLPIRWRHQQDL